MGKIDVYKIIINKEIPYEKLADQIKIDEFVNAFTGKEKLLNDNGIKFTYGVNVRISKKSDKDILPFSYSCPYFESVVAAKKVDPGKNIPDFIKESQLKEICFCAIFNDNTNTYDITFIDDVLEDFSGICVSRIFNPFNNKTVPNNSIKHFFDSGNTFLHENRKGLGIDDEPVYVWICGEDPDVSMDSETTYLTNIVAITNSHDTLKKFVNEKRLDILKFVMLLKSRRTDDFYIKQREEAIKSAKAAIMSRNMSHNIGSHVMSYLKQNLCSVQNILKNGVLNNIIDGNNIVFENGESRLKSNLDKDVKDVALPFLVGMGHFISYLQERQDFIATVATDYIPYNSIINFKDDIYDILNPDKRVARHAERTSSMATDNILIGNIARSEGLGRIVKKDGQKQEDSDIVLKFRSSFDGDPVGPGTKADKELEEMRKYNLSLPGGILGRQALFSIMENIIRNAAKHGSEQTEESPNLEFTFDIFTKQDVQKKERIELSQNDGVNGNLSLCQVLEKFYINASDSNELYFITITDNCDCSEQSLGKLRKALLEKYLDEEKGTMNNSNKGLKEIRISAAWLRTIRNEEDCFCPMPSKKKSPSTLSNKDFEKDCSWPELQDGTISKAPLIYARLSRLENEKWALQYIICLPIPQAIAIISDSADFIFSQEIKCHLDNYYWKVYTTAEFNNVHDKSFEFILCDGKTYSEVRPYTTSRTIQLDKIDGLRKEILELIINQNLSEKKNIDILKKLYHSFAKQSDKDVLKEKIIIADGGAESSNDHIYVDSSTFEGEYMYRSHHETDKQFLSFMKHLEESGKKNIKFVEGVTGNNSTDRLIRHGDLNDIWFYRHLHAMKQQIAVFDERLFSTITGRGENDFCENEVFTDGHKALTYIQKGIFPFTLIAEENIFKIIGCLCKCVKNDNNEYVDIEHVYNNKYELKCTCLAEIKYTPEEGPQIVPVLEESNTYIKNYFNFITIHQGLLDKLYECFEIKDSPEEKNKMTLKLYDFLSANQHIIDINKNTFLPGLSIHSGRSKPSKSDMPQRVPFIQFAALEHAISDCKFTIVELLDNARYED